MVWITIVCDLVHIDLGLYKTKTPGTYPNINIVIEPLGDSSRDFIGAIFGRTGERIIYDVPEREGEGYVTIKASQTKLNEDVIFIIKAGEKKPVFQEFALAEMNELIQKIERIDESREIERVTFETYLKQRGKLKFDEVVQIVKSLTGEEKREFKRRYTSGEMGMEVEGG